MADLTPVRKQLGPLVTHLVDGGPNPRSLCVLCHGYGAPGTDLVGLAVPLLRALQSHASDWRFIFPMAPNSLAELGMPDGRAWWPINMQALLAVSASGQWDEVRDKEPPGIETARNLLVAMVEAARQDLATENPTIVLGGFSQGAMLSMDVATRGLADAPDGLVLFSGTLVCEPSWKAGAAQRFKGLPVFQSHGTWDSILPFGAAEQLAKLLQNAGSDLRFMPFRGDHTIPSEAIREVADMLNAIASKRLQ